jgi:hypothetical protein
MYASEVDVTRLRKRALLGNGRPQQYPDGVFYGVGSQAINRVPCSQFSEIREYRDRGETLRSLLRMETLRVRSLDFESSKKN